MRANRRSHTSDWVAGLRALYTGAPDGLGVVEDRTALELLPARLAWPLRAFTATRLGMRAAHRALGAVSFGLTYGVPLRTAAIDAAIRDSVDDGVQQLVLLGAGLDARAWRMPELARATVFELDHPSTQAFKRERVAGLRLRAAALRHVPIDFEQQRIDDVLADAGFDTRARSIWVWEGVTMYLTHAAIDLTLDAIARLAAPGSVLAITYVPRIYGRLWVRAIAKLGARAVGEHLTGLIDADDLARRLEARGFSIDSDDTAIEWAARFWPAAERDPVREYERLVVCKRT